jgi:tRNA pseudouridine55 synthase
MDGVLNFLKPPGMTSNAAVVLLRKLTGIQKIGHAGTLDPGACGVLPICVGKATRISDYMMRAKKEYIAEVVFGKRTDTGDSYGTVIQTSGQAPPEEEDVIRTLQKLSGCLTQQTPAYSAVRAGGKKRYELARRGEAVPPHTRQIEIYESEYLGVQPPALFAFAYCAAKARTSARSAKTSDAVWGNARIFRSLQGRSAPGWISRTPLPRTK